MHGFAGLMMSTVIACCGPVTRDMARQADVTASDLGEAYVAELDADWNVSREIRVPCSVDDGCSVDLGLGDPGLAAVHVRFDPMHAGKVEVSSRLEDRVGHASAAKDETLAIDRSGFGAGHYEASVAPAGTAGKIFLIAVRVPGWTARGTAAARAERT